MKNAKRRSLLTMTPLDLITLFVYVVFALFVWFVVCLAAVMFA